MKSVLVVIQEPKKDDRKAIDLWTTLWQDQELPNLTIKGIERLALNVFLIELDAALPAFCGLVYRAHKWGVPYKVLYFQEEPEWLHSRLPMTPQ